MEKIVFAFPGGEELAGRLVRKLKISRGSFIARSFPDGESYSRIMSDVLGKEAIVVCPMDKPDNKFLGLFFFLQNLQDLGAGRIVAVIPYLPYMRQDKRFKDGEALTSKYFARLLSTCADELITIDPHLHRIKSLSEIYSNCCVVLQSASLIRDYIRTEIKNPMIIGPDSESSQWVADIAKQLDVPYIVLAKKRKGDRNVHVSGAGILKYKEFSPVIVDDIISTAQTLIETVKAVTETGLKKPVCIGIHGLFADNAYRELKNAGALKIITTNTVTHPSNKIDVSSLVAEALK